jgi:hypothetical protein
LLLDLFIIQIKKTVRNKNKVVRFLERMYTAYIHHCYVEQSDIRDEKFGFGDYKHGQFNYFFRVVYLPGDMILHGLPLASAVCRFADIDKYMNIICISTNQESFVLRQPFVALTNVFSIKLLVGGRDIYFLRCPSN